MTVSDPMSPSKPDLRHAATALAWALAAVGIVVWLDVGHEIRLGGARQTAAKDLCPNCGTIEGVRALQPGSVQGAQSGRSTSIALLGALSGASAGMPMERVAVSDTSYRVTVRMEDGTRRTVYSVLPPGFGVGERVRVVNGALTGRG